MKDASRCYCPTCGKPTILYAFRGVTPLKEDEAYRARIKNLIAQFQMEGYETYEKDRDVSVAISQMMVVRGEQPHLQKLLAHHMERVIAASFLETL